MSAPGAEQTVLASRSTGRIKTRVESQTEAPSVRAKGGTAGGGAPRPPEPGVEFDCRLAPDHILEPGDKIARLGEERDAALDCGDRDCLRLRQIMAARGQQTRDRSS